MAGYGAVWKARLEMMRPGNGLMVVVAVWLGVALTSSGELQWPYHLVGAWIGQGDAQPWIAAPLAAFLVNSFGNVLNDLVDRRIDVAAHPHRPLPSGRLEVRDAQAFAALLLAIGLVEAWVAGGLLLVGFAAAVAALLALYEWRLKRLPLVGNLAVAALVASALAFGAVAAGAPVATWAPLWWVMGMVALTTLARELLKDIEDAGADRGRRTMGQAMPRAAAYVAAAAVGVAVGIDAHLVRSQEAWTFAGRAVLAAAGISFVAAAGIGCWRPAMGQRALKAAMLLALLGLGLAALS